MEIIRQLDLRQIIHAALAEDVGQGDITTAATVTPGHAGRARITVKEPADIVFCGGFMFAEVFAMTGGEPQTRALANEGAKLPPNTIAAEIDGGLAGPAAAPGLSIRARPIRDCARWKSTPCAAAAALITGSVSIAAC